MFEQIYIISIENKNNVLVNSKKISFVKSTQLLYWDYSTQNQRI